MNKLKKLLLGALVSCTAVCAAVGFASCKDKIDWSDYPDTREPAGYVPDKTDDPTIGEGEYNGKYVVSLKSAGGMSLNGVRVAAKQNGVALMEGISVNGTVEFALEKGVYDIEINESSLPEGYYIPEDTTYSTVADKSGVQIALPSSIIPTTAPSDHAYNLGDVMHDFAFYSVDGDTTTRYTLSEMLGGDKKAIVLNFWFAECGPCRAEFPAIEEAYKAYSEKLDIIALSARDSNSAVATFKSTNNLTFHMGYDSPGLTNMFGINAFPTTVIVDRYGAIAYVSSGTQPLAETWKGLFNFYTSDDYTQNDPTDPDDPVEPTERTKPTEGLKMPASSEVAAAINGVGTEGRIGEYVPETGADAEYSWPWVIKEDDGVKYLTASNSKQGFSFSIFMTTVTLHSGEALSYEYNVDTEADCDILFALVDGSIVANHSGNSGGWQKADAVYVADRTITFEFAFIYNKDEKKEVGEDSASVRNINIRPYSEIMSDVKILDMRYSATDGLVLDNGKYKLGDNEFKVTSLSMGDDGYYYVSYRDELGRTRTSLLLTDILKATLWSEKHIGSPVFTTPENTTEPTSVYDLSYWLMSNYADTEKSELLFDYLDEKGSKKFIESYYLQEFSDNGYLPVNETRMQLLKDFTAYCYQKTSGTNSFMKDEYYEDQWLELCFYYKHLRGKEHFDCNEKADPILGLSEDNAMTATLGKNEVSITKMINLGDGGGVKFKFVPDKTGVYYFHSEYEVSGTDPRLIIMDTKGNTIVDNVNDLGYDTFHNPKRDNFYAYAELQKGKTYYLHTTMSYALSTGDYDFYIEYAGTYVEYLRVCSEAEGAWTYDPADPTKYIYIAVSVAYNKDDGYYHVTKGSELGSVVYIDFIHGNYLDQNNNSIYDMILGGVFDFRKNGGKDYTSAMMNYYQKSIAGKDRSDELYGMIEADATLVNIINDLVYILYDDGPDANVWLMLACYYEYYGVKP